MRGRDTTPLLTRRHARAPYDLDVYHHCCRTPTTCFRIHLIVCPKPRTLSISFMKTIVSSDRTTDGMLIGRVPETDPALTTASVAMMELSPRNLPFQMAAFANVDPR